MIYCIVVLFALVILIAAYTFRFKMDQRQNKGRGRGRGRKNSPQDDKNSSVGNNPAREHEKSDVAQGKQQRPPADSASPDQKKAISRGSNGRRKFARRLGFCHRCHQTGHIARNCGQAAGNGHEVGSQGRQSSISGDELQSGDHSSSAAEEASALAKLPKDQDQSKGEELSGSRTSRKGNNESTTSKDVKSGDEQQSTADYSPSSVQAAPADLKPSGDQNLSDLDTLSGKIKSTAENNEHTTGNSIKSEDDLGTSTYDSASSVEKESVRAKPANDKYQIEGADLHGSKSSRTKDEESTSRNGVKTGVEQQPPRDHSCPTVTEMSARAKLPNDQNLGERDMSGNKKPTTRKKVELGGGQQLSAGHSSSSVDESSITTYPPKDQNLSDGNGLSEGQNLTAEDKESTTGNEVKSGDKRKPSADSSSSSVKEESVGAQRPGDQKPRGGEVLSGNQKSTTQGDESTTGKDAKSRDEQQPSTNYSPSSHQEAPVDFKRPNDQNLSKRDALSGAEKSTTKDKESPTGNDVKSEDELQSSADHSPFLVEMSSAAAYPPKDESLSDGHGLSESLTEDEEPTTLKEVESGDKRKPSADYVPSSVVEAPPRAQPPDDQNPSEEDDLRGSEQSITEEEESTTVRVVESGDKRNPPADSATPSVEEAPASAQPPDDQNPSEGDDLKGKSGSEEWVTEDEGSSTRNDGESGYEEQSPPVHLPSLVEKSSARAQPPDDQKPSGEDALSGSEKPKTEDEESASTRVNDGVSGGEDQSQPDHLLSIFEKSSATPYDQNPSETMKPNILEHDTGKRINTTHHKHDKADVDTLKQEVNRGELAIQALEKTPELEDYKKLQERVSELENDCSNKEPIKQLQNDIRKGFTENIGNLEKQQQAEIDALKEKVDRDELLAIQALGEKSDNLVSANLEDYQKLREKVSELEDDCRNTEQMKQLHDDIKKNGERFYGEHRDFRDTAPSRG